MTTEHVIKYPSPPESTTAKSFPTLPQTEEQAKGLAYKLVQVAKHCAYIQKDKKNTAQGYNYASDEAFMRKVNEATVEQGIAVIPRDITILETDTVTSKSGSVSKRFTIKLALELIDSETLQRATLIGLGEGMDPGDKGINKALTSARKNAWRIALNVATGDDPEADSSTDKHTGNVSAPVGGKFTAAHSSLSDIGQNLLTLLDKVTSSEELKTVQHLLSENREKGKLNDTDLAKLAQAFVAKKEEITATEIA